MSVNRCSRFFFVLVGACLGASACFAAASEPRSAPSVEEAPAETGIVCSSADAGGIRRVIVRGAADRSPCARLRTIAGRGEDARLVESDIEALFATAAYADVVVVREGEGGEVDLVFELEERPRIASVALDGAASEAAKAALAAVALGTPERVDPAWLRKSERALREALVDEGFSRATVQAAVQRRDAAPEASVRFVIDEGPQTRLTRLVIAGLRVASEKDLREKLHLRAGAPAPPSLVERDALVLSMELYDLGLLESKLEKQIVTSDDGTGMEVVFTVKEGPVHRLRKVEIGGDARLEAKRYAALLARLKSGAPFSRSVIQEVKTKLEALHGEAGQPADVEPKVDVEPGRTGVDVTFEITPR